MLCELLVENFAIIDRLLVRFSPGLTVLTGETGAGKSIIVDALQTALGARIAGDVVRTDARMATVEAVFDPSASENESIRAILNENGIPSEDCLILRREVQAGGRSTGRLNGRAVPASVLQAVGSVLVDIHGQSEHLSILRREKQLDVLDRFGGLLELRTHVAAAVRDFQRARRSLSELEEHRREAEQRLDLLRFQVQEIDAARLALGEESDLEAQRLRLANAERLAELAAAAYDRLGLGTAGASEPLTEALSATRDLAAIDVTLTPLAERLESLQYELEDVAQELRQYRDTIEYDPAGLNAVEERLDLLSRLKRKYGPSVDDIIAFGQRARRDLDAIENYEERLASASEAVDRASEQAGRLAAELSAVRRKAAGSLTVAVVGALQGLGLKTVEFRVDLQRSPDDDGLLDPETGERLAIGPHGFESVAFLVSFNSGEALRPLERVASGGETSRFMLALRGVLSAADRIPTLIFDEVDVGVGGRAATAIGKRLRSLAAEHQVLSITHLPQVAALADHHLAVSKASRDSRTTVDVRSLDDAERVAELAEMMTGTGTEAARRNAEELLQAAQAGG